jgi:predicted component of type VI protein secretion system
MGSELPTAVPAVIQVLSGPLVGLEVPVTAEPLTLGTAEDCRVVLPADDGRVERRHARIWHRDGRYMLHRLARSAPVTVNGQPVQWVVLEPDDEVVIGPHRLRFRVDGSAWAGER